MARCARVMTARPHIPRSSQTAGSRPRQVVSLRCPQAIDIRDCEASESGQYSRKLHAAERHFCHAWHAHADACFGLVPAMQIAESV